MGTVATARAKKVGGCQGADCENAVAAEPLVVWLLVFARCPALELMSGIYDRGVRDGVFRGNLDPVEIYLSILLELFLCVESLHAVRVSRDKPSRRTIEVLAALGLGRDRASDQGNLNPH